MKNINIKKILKVLKITCVAMGLIELALLIFVGSSCISKFDIINIILLLTVGILGFAELSTRDK